MMQNNPSVLLEKEFFKILTSKNGQNAEHSNTMRR